MSKYNLDLHLDDVNSTSLIISMIKERSCVLEFGPAHGRLTKYMTNELNCVVDIVELDYDAGLDARQYARYACIGSEEGNACGTVWSDRLQNERYDYIIFEDVLEHLYHPEEVLERVCSFLKEDGSILVSIPNVAHASILIQLLNDRFTYNRLGLLDDTHIHLFTYSSFIQMIEKLGLVTVKETATFSAAAATEFGVSLCEIPSDVAKHIIQKKYSNVYQFVFELKSSKAAIPGPRLVDNKIDLFNRYFGQCYISADNTAYCEESSSIQYYNPLQTVTLTFSIPDNAAPLLRIDPVNANCVLRMNAVTLQTDNGDVPITTVSCNGYKVLDNCYLFTTDDPQFYIDTSGTDRVKKVTISFELLDFDSDNVSVMHRIWELMNKKILNEVQHFSQAMAEKEAGIAEMDKTIKERDTAIAVMDHAIREKEAGIAEMDKAIKERDAAIAVMDHAIREKEAGIAEMDKAIKERDTAIAVMDHAIREKEAGIAEMDKVIMERDSTISEMRVTIKQKNSCIAVAEKRLAENDEEINKLNAVLIAKDSQAADLQRQIDEANKIFMSKRFKLLKKLRIIN